MASVCSCPLCLKKIKDPRALPCLHTFCRKCLDQHCNINQHNGAVKCPICNKCHRIPKNGAKGFPKDFKMQNYMETARKKEQSASVAMCQRHPTMEVSYFCKERTCQDLLCSQCVVHNHRFHDIQPVKSTYKERVRLLKMMERATQHNRELVQYARSELDQNTDEILEEVKRQIKKCHAKLDLLERRITNDVNHRAYEEHLWINEREKNTLQEADSLVERISDTIPNMALSSWDKLLGRDFYRLHDILDNWSLEYSLLKVDTSKITAVDNALSTDMDEFFVKILPEKVLTGVPVVGCDMLTAPKEAKPTVTWQQKDYNIRGVACHQYGGGGVTVVSSSHLRVYKQTNGEMFHSNEHKDDVNRVTTFRGSCHAVLDRHHDEVRIYYDWPIFLSNEKRTICVPGRAGYALSGTENYLVVSTRHNKIVCYAVDSSPEKKWHLNLESVTPRSLSAMETRNELVVVVANSCTDGIPEKKAKGLVALNDSTKAMWWITFKALDMETNLFDLIDMSNDGRFFYVLNSKANCVYLISSDGKVLSKILQNLERPLRIAANPESKDLVVASGGGTVTVYKLLYEKL